ncbi:unnamed protein product [Pocillopora meandrina]|uniref:F5/8 type C domain-containing protein n=1 Tax=Pocillopora meandrina TaxID=46732 RepID=A0AAU9WI20_9CNID|nr:unnamed protein product [Pocillopora meandrina]
MNDPVTGNTSSSSRCEGKENTNSYLQIDLQTRHFICHCFLSNEGGTTYAMELSVDGTNWTTNKNEKFRNSGSVLKVNHNARYLRFWPKAGQGKVCMTTEIFGMELEEGTTVSYTTGRTSTTAETTIPTASTTAKIASASTTESITAETTKSTKNSVTTISYTTTRTSTTAETTTPADVDIMTTEDYGKQQLYHYAVYALAGIVLVFLVIIGALIRRLRQAVRTGRNIVTDHDIPVSPAERQESESGHYMELRPPQMQSPEPTYESLQSRYSTHYYSNVGFVGEKSGNDDVRVYENVESGGIV